MKDFAYRLAFQAGLLSFLAAVSLAARVSPLGFRGVLRAATLQAFSLYADKTERSNAESLENGPFLWMDGLPENQRTKTFRKLRAGEVEIRRLSVSADGSNIEVPGGLIHDWVGTVFISGAKLDDVLKVLEDYNHQAIYYAPDVSKSRLEFRDGDHYRVFLQFKRHKLVTVVLNTEHDVTYYRDSPLRAHSRSSAIRIAQVEDPGGPNEKEKAPGEDDGFLWRMETWWRMEERDGGVYVQSEALTLTRDIPAGLGWLLEPFILKIPEETLLFTLRATRQAVLEQSQN